MDTRDNAPLIAAGGGLLLLISLFLNWLSGVNFWEAHDIADFVMALIAILAIAVGVGRFTGNEINLPGGPGTVYTAGLIAFAIVAYLVLEAEDRDFGMFLGLIGTIAIIYGALQLEKGAGAGTGPRTRAVDQPTAPQPTTPAAQQPPSSTPPPGGSV